MQAIVLTTAYGELRGDRASRTLALLSVWHIRRPHLHALEAVIFIGSLVIVWLGVSLAH